MTRLTLYFLFPLLYFCLSVSWRMQQFLVMGSSRHFSVLTVGASFLLTPERAGLEESCSLTDWLTDWHPSVKTCMHEMLRMRNVTGKVAGVGGICGSSWDRPDFRRERRGLVKLSVGAVQIDPTFCGSRSDWANFPREQGGHWFIRQKQTGLIKVSV